MNDWGNFFTAVAGAAATLTGLIFVGVSISLARILAIPRLPGRAAQSLILLLSVLIISSLCLVPGQSVLFTGIWLLSLSIVLWVITLRLDIGMLKNTEAPYKRYSIQNIVFTQLAVLPYIVAGVVILTVGPTGMYWLVPGFIFSFIKAVTDAWVLLVEIHR